LLNKWKTLSDSSVKDVVDLRILAVLQQDASLSNAQLAARVGLSPSPCWRRVRRLERDGVIRGTVALLDLDKLGMGIVVFASVKLSGHGRQALPEFESAIREYPEVLECYTVTGEVDFILRIVTQDMHTYEDFLRHHLLQMPTVAEVHSTIALTQVKYTTALPLELLPG
jgi:Lrp/AsnC family transcriptional regulator